MKKKKLGLLDIIRREPPRWPPIPTTGGQNSNPKPKGPVAVYSDAIKIVIRTGMWGV